MTREKIEEAGGPIGQRAVKGERLGVLVKKAT